MVTEQNTSLHLAVVRGKSKKKYYEYLIFKKCKEQNHRAYSNVTQEITPAVVAKEGMLLTRFDVILESHIKAFMCTVHLKASELGFFTPKRNNYFNKVFPPVHNRYIHIGLSIRK